MLFAVVRKHIRPMPKVALSTFAGRLPKYHVKQLLYTAGCAKTTKQTTPKPSPMAMMVPTVAGPTDHTACQYRALMANCVDMPKVVKKKHATTVAKKQGEAMRLWLSALLTCFPAKVLDRVLPKPASSSSSSTICMASMFCMLTRVLPTPAVLPLTLARLFRDEDDAALTSATTSSTEMLSCL
jgi:hypothetical protein